MDCKKAGISRHTSSKKSDNEGLVYLKQLGMVEAVLTPSWCHLNPCEFLQSPINHHDAKMGS